MIYNSSYTNKKVLILGLGLNQGGVGSARFFARAGAKVKVTDLKNQEILKPSIDQLKEFKNITYTLGKHKEEDIDWADLIVKNPALKNDNSYLNYALEKGKQVEMDMGIFLQFVSPKKIIGITGSKGKSTTSALLYEVLSKTLRVKLTHTGGGISRHIRENEIIFAGNIGKSVLDATPFVKENTIVVLEISSFQLQAFDQHKTSPHVAVITNIFPEHLNYYRSFEDYKNAKRVIAKYQTSDDYLFLNQDDKTLTSEVFSKDLKGKIIYFSSESLPSDFKPILPGEHNKLAYSAVLAVAKGLGVKETEALQRMNEFKGAEFRLQVIKEIDGIKIINDSSSTNPNATIVALKTYPNSILICGGMNKGLDYKELAKAIEKKTKEVYFLEGDATDILESQITNHKPRIAGTFNNLNELLKAVKKQATSRDIILFSPGATSFNLFQNEFDRGRKFNQAVEEVFK